MKCATTDAMWKRVHGELVRLARSKGAYDAEEARWLLEGKRVRVHEPLGYGTFVSYIEYVLGYGPRMASERLRVAEALVQLPVMAAALATNELCWSAVRELTRVATSETEVEWIAAARGKSMREVEDRVSGRRRGDLPTDPADPAAKRHVLRLEISGDALAAFREARKHLELEVGHSLDDDDAVRMLAHYALGGPGDPGRSVYQVAMTICEQCGRGTRDGAGRELAVEDHAVEAALCDAQHIGCTHVDEPAAAAQDIPPRIRRQVVRRAHGRCEVPGCRAAKHLEIHHIIPRSQGGTHDPSNLLLTCSAHHMQVHDGALRVSGAAPDGLVFRRRHPTWPERAPATAGTPARAQQAEMASNVRQDALDALRGRGFSAAQARRAVAASPAIHDLETLLRQALRHLHPVHASRRPSRRRATHRGLVGRLCGCAGQDASPSLMPPRPDTTSWVASHRSGPGMRRAGRCGVAGAARAGDRLRRSSSISAGRSGQRSWPACAGFRLPARSPRARLISMRWSWPRTPGRSVGWRAA